MWSWIPRMPGQAGKLRFGVVHICVLVPPGWQKRLHGVPDGLWTRKGPFDGKQRGSQFKGSDVLAQLLSAIRLVTFRQWGSDCVDMTHPLSESRYKLCQDYCNWLNKTSLTKKFAVFLHLQTWQLVNSANLHANSSWAQFFLFQSLIRSLKLHAN